MKTSLFVFLFHLSALLQLSAQCQIITLPYGQVEIDINRGYKIIPTQDSNFVIAGEWNNEAFLLKVNGQGTQLALQKYGSAVTGQSLFQDVVEAPDGGFVAVGECDNCVVPNDSLIKVIAIKTDANLNLDATIGVKKFGAVTLPGGGVTKNEQASPRIVRTGNTYLLASGITRGFSVNWADLCLTRLSGDLTPIWAKVSNNAPDAFFEAPADIAATDDGFVIPVLKAFIPNVTLLKVDSNGTTLWTKTVDAEALRSVAYLPASGEVIAIGNRTPAGQDQQALLMLFDAATGMAKDSLLFGDNLGDEGHDIQVLPGGNLLAGVMTVRPNLFGTYATSRMYRIRANPLSVNCFYLVPNPDNITNMSVRSIVPLSDNGKDFVVTGIRGFYNRTFFHTRLDCETSEVSAIICPGDSYTLPDGTMVDVAGTYNTTLSAMNGCDSIVQTTVSQYASIPTTVVGASLCPGETHILPNGQSVSTAGVYDVTLQAANGCDSLIQTTVTTLTSPVTPVSVVLCPGESYTLENGQVVDAAGVYDITYTATNGCDSILRTVIEVLDAPVIFVDVMLCAGQYYVLPNGDSVNSGAYEFPYTAPNGCIGIEKVGITSFSPIIVGNADVQLDDGQNTGSISLSNVSGGAGVDYEYHWSNGADTPAIDSLSPGVYDVTISDSFGCDAIFSYSIIVGLNNPVAGLHFQLTPNPFSDQLSVALKLEQPSSDRYELRLFDARGRRCKTQSLVSGSIQTLETGDLSAGIYFVQLIENEKVVLSRRVVKQ